MLPWKQLSNNQCASPGERARWVPWIRSSTETARQGFETKIMVNKRPKRLVNMHLGTRVAEVIV